MAPKKTGKKTASKTATKKTATKKVANKATEDPKVKDRNTSDGPLRDTPHSRDKASDKPAPHTVGDNPAKAGPGTNIPPRGMGSTPPRSDEPANVPAGTRPNEEEQKNEDGKKGIAEGGIPAENANVVTPEAMLEAAGSPEGRKVLREGKEDQPLLSKPFGNRPGKVLEE